MINSGHSFLGILLVGFSFFAFLHFCIWFCGTGADRRCLPIFLPTMPTIPTNMPSLLLFSTLLPAFFLPSISVNLPYLPYIPLPYLGSLHTPCYSTTTTTISSFLPHHHYHLPHLPPTYSSLYMHGFGLCLCCLVLLTFFYHACACAFCLCLALPLPAACHAVSSATHHLPPATACHLQTGILPACCMCFAWPATYITACTVTAWYCFAFLLPFTFTH